MKKLENEQAKNQNSPPFVEDIKDIFIEGKNSDSTFWSKKDPQITPLSSNLQNYIESFQFETPIAANGGKLMNSTTPSSNVASITTATSMRKTDINSPLVGGKSSPESRNISLYNDSCKKQRYVQKGGTKNLMKQSLERIDNAIKRFSKNNGTDIQTGPFELTSNSRSQSQNRDYLNSQCSSQFGGHMQIGNDPNSVIQPQAFSDSVSNTIIWESETHDIENFTLGPAQFKEFSLDQVFKNSSGRNLLVEFQKENGSRVKESRDQKRRTNGKNSSADRANIQKKHTYYSGAPNELAMLANQSQVQSPFVPFESKQSFMRRQRGSAPNIELTIGPNNDVQKGVMIDEGYKHYSTRESTKLNINFKGIEYKNEKVPRPTGMYYLQPSPQSKYQDPKASASVKNSANKFNGYRLQDGRSRLGSLNRGTLKVGSKGVIELLKHSKVKKKFPKDFF
jgi:hypothetical protein